mmetsp:Transcript_6871/g.17585  ORF Transcript_6871/g.17585 Transcript_6871/m.17585 type:complete len:182 (+) Transcript_6871:43-588(+)
MEARLGESQAAVLRDAFQVAASARAASEEAPDGEPLAIRRAQLCELLHMLGMAVSDEEAATLGVTGADQGSLLSLEEVEYLVSEYMYQTEAYQVVDEAFAALQDGISDGVSESFITADSMFDKFQQMGDKAFALADCERIIDLLGTAGKLTWADFRRFLLYTPTSTANGEDPVAQQRSYAY